MVDRDNRPAITPDLKIGDLLNAYPELEDVLIDIAPAFKKLRNPVLRRTVAKLTSLRQAAQVGGVSLGDMIGRLRTAAGCQQAWSDNEDAPQENPQRPRWLGDNEPVETYDAIELIEAGGHPLPEVMSALRKLEPGQIYAVLTPFLPAPMIDKAREAGYQAWTDQRGKEEFTTYFIRRDM